MLDPRGLISKHRAKGALFDTNLLVLFLVGAVNRERIEKFKRTKNFTIDDFEFLQQLMDWFGKVITTPHVLSQVSDLTDLRDQELSQVRHKFKLLIRQSEEAYDPSLVLTGDPVFERLGLADAAIATVCSRGILVVTADLDLHIQIQRRGAETLNFNHVRKLGWQTD